MCSEIRLLVLLQCLASKDLVCFELHLTCSQIHQKAHTSGVIAMLTCYDLVSPMMNSLRQRALHDLC